MSMDRYALRSRNLRVLIPGVALVLVWAAKVDAQEPQVITLESAIEIALDNNPTVQQSENATRLSMLTVQQQERNLLPQLNLNTGTAVQYATPGVSADPNLSAGLSANLNIGNIYSTVADLRQARINETGSRASLERSRQTVIFNVLSNYLSLIEAQEQLAVQQRNLETVLAQEAQIQAYVDAGRRPISDLYQAQASTASARLSLVQAERSLVLSRMNLIRTLQLDPFEEYEFVVPEMGPLSVTFSSLDLAQMTEQAMTQRPDLKAAEASVASAEQGVRIADATRWPSLSLQLGYSSGSFNSSSAGNFFDQLDRGRRGTLAFNVSVPLLDPTRGVRRERARISLENAEITLESSKLAIATEVRSAYLDLQLAEQQLAVAEAQLEAANLALEMAQQRYDVNVATLVELTQAQTAQVRAASALVNARYGLVFRSRIIDYYLGQLDADGIAG